MNTKNFDRLFVQTMDEVSKLSATKGKDYASEEDRLSNFKVNAERTGLTPYQVWSVYANKHWDAVMAFIRNNGQLESEPIESRIYDLITYLILLSGLIEDAKDE